MRILLIGVAGIALSGCSWFGGSGQNHTNSNGAHNGYYSGNSNNNCCVGGKKMSRWNIEGAVGPEFIVGGDAITSSNIHAVNDGVVATQSMQDAFDPGMRYELGGSYALSPNRKVTLMGSYAQADGEQVTLGTDLIGAVTGDMSDYQRFGVEVGLRQYVAPIKMPLVKSIRPYVEGKLGAAHVDDIGLSNAQQAGAAYNGGTVGLYESSWVPTGAGMLGFEAPVFKRATLGVESGIRYTGAMKSDTSTLNGANPFSGANNGTASWTVPVMLRGRYRF